MSDSINRNKRYTYYRKRAGMYCCVPSADDVRLRVITSDGIGFAMAVALPAWSGEERRRK
jgi:hypothetical protein